MVACNKGPQGPLYDAQAGRMGAAWRRAASNLSTNQCFTVRQHIPPKRAGTGCLAALVFLRDASSPASRLSMYVPTRQLVSLVLLAE